MRTRILTFLLSLSYICSVSVCTPYCALHPAWRKDERSDGDVAIRKDAPEVISSRVHLVVPLSMLTVVTNNPEPLLAKFCRLLFRTRARLREMTEQRLGGFCWSRRRGPPMTGGEEKKIVDHDAR